jgi:hypothetical protein
MTVLVGQARSTRLAALLLLGLRAHMYFGPRVQARLLKLLPRCWISMMICVVLAHAGVDSIQ